MILCRTRQSTEPLKRVAEHLAASLESYRDAG
jgi:hypothetical protein